MPSHDPDMDEVTRDLLEQLRSLRVESELLDEAVHEVFSQQATSVNNQGLPDQVELLVQHYGLGQAVDVLNEQVLALDPGPIHKPTIGEEDRDGEERK